MKSGLFNRSLADRGARLSGAPALSPLVSPTVCEKTVLPPSPGSTVALSDSAMILVRAVATYEGCTNAAAITMALGDYVKKVGAGPLARAVLDAEPVERSPVVTFIPFINDGEDVADVPAFARLGENRFRSGGP